MIAEPERTIVSLEVPDGPPAMRFTSENPASSK